VPTGGRSAKVDRLGRSAGAAVAVDLGEHRLAQVGRGRFAFVGREQDRPDDHAFEHRCRVRVDLLGREARLHVAEHAEDRFGSGNRLADVDRADHGVGKVRARLDSPLLDVVGEDEVELRDLAVDLGLGRRGGDRIGDHRAHVGQRGSPVLAERGDVDIRAVGRTAGFLPPDRGEQEAAALARARLEAGG
jgi:hypothetical protein